MTSPNSLQPVLASSRLTWCLIAALGLFYALLFPTTQPDHFLFLLPWLRAITSNPGLSEFATDFSNYTGGYLTFLWATSALEPILSELAVIKLAAVLGSLLLATAIWVCLGCFGWQGTARFNAALIALVLPTVMLNGIGWGQADAFYTSFLVLSLAAVLCDRRYLAALAFAIAVAFKLQAMFFGPFLLGYMLRNPRALIAGLVMLVPTYLAVNLIYLAGGRPVSEVLSIYLDQANTYHRLSMNAGNPWLLVDLLVPPEVLAPVRRTLILAGLLGATVTGLIIAWRVAVTAKTSQTLLWFACLSTLIMPYILPKMHDRFFFPAEIMLIVALFTDRRYLAPAVLAQLSGACMYAVYHDTLGLRALFGWPNVALIGMVFLALALVTLIRLRPATASTPC